MENEEIERKTLIKVQNATKKYKKKNIYICKK